MRKTSQDGGDNTSITSGVENEIKKPLVGIMKTKRTSIKRKVQNFSHESDDAVIEPLLQKDKTDIPSQSAKQMLPKTKTESSSEKGGDRDKLLSDERIEKPSLSNAPSGIGSNSIVNETKEITNHKPKYEGSSTIHNHMNTNIFGSFEGVKNIPTPKTQILVEIDSSKSTGYSPSPLIFTTAKIHKDGNTKHMEPVQVTPVPILSTIEGNVKIGIGCTDKILPGVSTKSNNLIDTIHAKSNYTESKIAKGTHNTKTSVTINNPSYSEIPCTLASGTPSEKKDGVDVKKNNPSNNTLANNSSMKPDVFVDISNVPTKTIKSDLNTICSNASTKCTFDNKEVTLKNMEAKDISKICENVVDVNKNIETNKTLSSEGRSSNNSTSISTLISKNATELDKKKDLYTPHTSNTDRTVKKIEMIPESNKSKTNDNKSKPKDTTSSPVCANTDLISSANKVPTSTKTSAVQITTSKLTSENVTSVTQTIAATTSSLTKTTGATITPKSATSNSTSLTSNPISTTAVSFKTTTTNVVSTDKQKVPNEVTFSKSTVKTQASNMPEKSVDASAAKMPMNTPSSKVQSTVSTIISPPKNSAANTLPTTSSSVKNVTSVMKTPSTPLPTANNVLMSVASTVVVTTNTNTGKSVDSATVKSKLNNLTKTISSTVDSNKTLNMPLTNVVPNATSSTESTAKAPEISTKVTKSTSSVSKPSTSVTTSKPAVVSSTVTSNSTKQQSIKPALSKSNSSTVSSVKTLITSSNNPSSTSGPVKKSLNKQTESKAADNKKA